KSGRAEAREPEPISLPLFRPSCEFSLWSRALFLAGDGRGDGVGRVEAEAAGAQGGAEGVEDALVVVGEGRAGGARVIDRSGRVTAAVESYGAVAASVDQGFGERLESGEASASDEHTTRTRDAERGPQLDRSRRCLDGMAVVDDQGKLHEIGSIADSGVVGTQDR